MIGGEYDSIKCAVSWPCPIVNKSSELPEGEAFCSFFHCPPPPYIERETLISSKDGLQVKGSKLLMPSPCEDIAELFDNSLLGRAFFKRPRYLFFESIENVLTIDAADRERRRPRFSSQVVELFAFYDALASKIFNRLFRRQIEVKEIILGEPGRSDHVRQLLPREKIGSRQRLAEQLRQRIEYVSEIFKEPGGQARYIKTLQPVDYRVECRIVDGRSMAKRSVLKLCGFCDLALDPPGSLRAGRAPFFLCSAKPAPPCSSCSGSSS